jgi:hypothetical protein
MTRPVTSTSVATNGADDVAGSPLNLRIMSGSAPENPPSSVVLKQGGIQISIKLPISFDEGRDVATPNEPALSRFVPMRMKRRGVEMRLIIDVNAASSASIDLPLLDATARAYRWSNDLLAGRARSIGEIARREHLTARHVRRVMRLAFLAPRIVEAIVEGRQPASLLLSRLDSVLSYHSLAALR